MADFSQRSSRIATFHVIDQDRKHLRSQLRLHSRWKKTVLIIPTLASEFTDPENRPVFENMLRQLRDVTYLSTIIFGLDRATQEDASLLRDHLRSSGMRHFLIQWNDGPGFTGIYEQLNGAGFAISQPGKGRNMFLSFGIAIALGARAIGLLDADIRTFRRIQIDRLLYPIVVQNYDFSKAYYARVSHRRIYGRVKRLLLDPLLLSLKMLTAPYRITERFLRFIHSHDELTPFLRQGLAEAVLEVEKKTDQKLFQTPQTVSWERVANKLPRIYFDLIDTIEEEKRVVA